MKLFRLNLTPESAWRTPWQSDTLSGMLCGAIARLDGNEVLRRDVIDPAVAGQPPFVLSDAFPGNWIPAPLCLRLIGCPPERRKDVKRSRWLASESFNCMQRGQPLAIQDLISESGFHESTHLHNTIGRASNTTSDGGDLFSREETLLAKGQQHLTVYVRVKDQFRDLFWRAIRELAFGGFGADRSTGKGQFRIDGELESADHLDAIDQSNGLLVLSTFQPAPTDPTDGAWDAFTKYGKLGPEFGLDNIFKRPLILFKPGACFRTPTFRPWLGRAIRMSELLSPETAQTLCGRGIEVIQYSFGLTIPIVWPTEWNNSEKTTRKERAFVDKAQTVSVESRPAFVNPTEPTKVKRTVGMKVRVKVLEAHATITDSFFVQEPDQPKRGLLTGVKPASLGDPPAIGAEIDVYINSLGPPPQYRWDQPPPPSQGKSKGGMGRQPPRGGRQ